MKKRLFFVISVALIIAISTATASASGSFLQTARACHDYIRTAGFHYSKGVAIPLDGNSSKRVDCSSFVSWVIYKYTNGRFSEAKDSNWFLGVAKALANGETPQMPELTSNWQVITDMSQLQPGDIMCYSGHVMIYAGVSIDGKPMAYNAGDNKFIQQVINPITEKRFAQARYGLRIP